MDPPAGYATCLATARRTPRATHPPPPRYIRAAIASPIRCDPRCHRRADVTARARSRRPRPAFRQLANRPPSHTPQTAAARRDAASPGAQLDCKRSSGNRIARKPIPGSVRVPLVAEIITAQVQIELWHDAKGNVGGQIRICCRLKEQRLGGIDGTTLSRHAFPNLRTAEKPGRLWNKFKTEIGGEDRVVRQPRVGVQIPGRV